jgi:hypothetical protein
MSRWVNRCSHLGPWLPCVLLAMVLVMPLPSSARVLEVPAEYGSIQSAVDAAMPSDVVQVNAGTYVEQIEIAKDITLEGSGIDEVVVFSPAVLPAGFVTGEGDAGRPVIFVHDATVGIHDLTIDGGALGSGNAAFIGVGFHNAGGSVERTRIRGIRQDPLSVEPFGVGLYVYNEDGLARTMRVASNSVYDYQQDGMVLLGSGLTADVNANAVVGPVSGNGPISNGIRVSSGVSAAIRHNEVSQNGVACSACGPDPVGDRQSSGILLEGAATGSVVEENRLLGNDVGVRAEAGGDLSFARNLSIGNRYAAIVVEGAKYELDGDRVIATDFGASGFWILGRNGGAATSARVENSCISGDMGGTGLLARSEGASLQVDVRNCELWLWDTALKAVGTEVSLGAAENSIHDNVTAGYDNTGCLHEQSAVMNWWGDAEGPSGAGPGSGGAVLPAEGSGVTFSPWHRTGIDLDPGCRFATDDGLLTSSVDPGRRGSTRLEIIGTGPNPSQGRIRIDFRLDVATYVSLRVWNSGGRLVRDVSQGLLPAGEHTLMWDGCDNEGHRAPSGAYFYALRTAEGERLSRSLLLLH